MDSLSTQFLTKPLSYRGLELKPHWIYENTGIMGNTLIAFKGPCEVTLDHMVDLEDVKKRPLFIAQKWFIFLANGLSILWSREFCSNIS